MAVPTARATVHEISAPQADVIRDHRPQPRVLSAQTAAALEAEARKDHFIYEDGHVFAGHHLIIDLFGARPLNDLERMEQAMREAVVVCGATLLHIHLHHFSPEGGVSGVAVLAESHISVHTWPERDYAAFDVFMCGDAKPELCIDVLRRAFGPARVEVGKHRRGVFHAPELGV